MYGLLRKLKRIEGEAVGRNYVSIPQNIVFEKGSLNKLPDLLKKHKSICIDRSNEEAASSMLLASTFARITFAWANQKAM